MDIASISAATAAVKTGFDILKVLKDLDTDGKIQTETAKLQGALGDALGSLLDARAATLELQDEVRQLKQENDHLKDFKAELAEKYTLKEIAPNRFAYKYNGPREGDTSPHYICQNCVSNGQKSILQWASGERRTEIFECHKCNSRINITWDSRHKIV